MKKLSIKFLTITFGIIGYRERERAIVRKWESFPSSDDASQLRPPEEGHLTKHNFHFDFKIWS